MQVVEDDCEPIPLPNVNSSTLKRILTWIAEHQVRRQLNNNKPFAIIFVWELVIIIARENICHHICLRKGWEGGGAWRAGRERVGQMWDSSLLPTPPKGFSSTLSTSLHSLPESIDKLICVLIYLENHEPIEYNRWSWGWLWTCWWRATTWTWGGSSSPPARSWQTWSREKVRSRSGKHSTLRTT